jgi:hypothetical protein
MLKLMRLTLWLLNITALSLTTEQGSLSGAIALPQITEPNPSLSESKYPFGTSPLKLVKPNNVAHHPPHTDNLGFILTGCSMPDRPLPKIPRYSITIARDFCQPTNSIFLQFVVSFCQ